jgi:hypothetical protein
LIELETTGPRGKDRRRALCVAAMDTDYGLEKRISWPFLAADLAEARQ